MTEMLSRAPVATDWNGMTVLASRDGTNTFSCAGGRRYAISNDSISPLEKGNIRVKRGDLLPYPRFASRIGPGAYPARWGALFYVPVCVRLRRGGRVAKPLLPF